MSDLEKIEEMRKLLLQWEKYARTMAEADVAALPERLIDKTVGILDATCC